MTQYNMHGIFDYFKAISAIPRPSGNEQAISNYMVDFAKNLGLEVYQDDHYNVLIKKPGTKGYETSPTVILQGHLDMVATKGDSSTHNFTTDGIELIIDGDNLHANQTTLGADDGFSLAYTMAILSSQDIPHPPLEVVYTVCEETTFEGAKTFEYDKLQGKYLLNLDGGEEHFITIGSAGGQLYIVNCPVQLKSINSDFTRRRIHVKGLVGGHSGTDIHKGRANANVLLARVLKKIIETHNVDVANLQGGSANNAIPREAYVDLYMPLDVVPYVTVLVKELETELREEFSQVESELTITCAPVKEENHREDLVDLDLSAVTLTKGITKDSLLPVLDLIVTLPNGVLETNGDAILYSNNIGLVVTEGETITINMQGRSTEMSQLEDLENRIINLLKGKEGTLEISQYYPGWSPVIDSPLQEIAKQAYANTYGAGKKPQLLVIHAGLEAGYFCEQLPELDAINIGPDIADMHAPTETMNLPSFERTYKFLLSVLELIK